MLPAWEGRQRGFPTTAWSLVALAGQENADGAREALGALLARYVPALQTHLLYKRLTPEEAEDLVQDFVADKILEKELIARAEQRLGKFRTFLLTALDRFLVDQIRADRAKKRSPKGGRLVSMADGAEGPGSDREVADAFDVAWARSVLGEALARMRAECETSGRADLWSVFECRVLAPILEDAEPLDYGQLVARFHFQSPSQAANALVTAKRMYARLLRAVVGQYARDDEEIDAEVRDLREILARSGQ